MTDADVDGAHIRTLLLTLFYRYFPQLITNSHLYIAQPPLYRLNKGKNARYAFSDKERDAIVQEFQQLKEETKGKTKAAPVTEEPSTDETSAETEGVTRIGNVNIQRYKGLGEMNAEQLWETTMDPANRVMKVVTIDDAEAANETFDILMGSEVGPRKKFIQTHAANANLDV
jgi:DNA gyrase subunit B